MQTYSYLTALLIILTLSSCSKEGSNGLSINAKSIDSYLENHSINDHPYLEIKHRAFSRDFILYGTFIPMLNSPTGHSLKGRIVRFQVFADRVIMLESPKGHSITNSDESIILLAEFPIVERNNSGVVIDFARGMNSAFTMKNVHSRAAFDQNMGVSTAEQFKAILLSASFIKAIDIDDNVLTISQIAQWRNQKSELISAEFRYYFREYLPSSHFNKSTFGTNRWVQYFSTPHMIEERTTEPIAYITKWDLKKPLVFYISANTPINYRDAVIDGILYWNHIIGKNIIEVRDLDPSIRAPHPRMNIVQWVMWDNEASAYADMVIDPLTGETLQAQIYLRSGWVIQSIKKLRNHLLELLLLDEPIKGMQSLEEDVPLPTMFDLDSPCLKTMGSFTEVADLTATISDDISDETITILTKDILRAVVAHEMGHVLGIRHNLAASTAGTMSIEERDLLLKTYLKTGKYNLENDKFLSRSVMDVFSAPDDALIGAQIRELLQKDSMPSKELRAIYEFDTQAIKFGYSNQPMQGNVAFCTDDDLTKYLDCRRWDLSNTGALFSASQLNNIMTEVAIVLADTFAQAIDPTRKGGTLAIKDIYLSNRTVIKILDQYAKNLFSWFSQKARSVQVEALLKALGPQNEEEINKARFTNLREQINDSGVEQTLFALLPPFRKENLNPAFLANTFSNHLRKLINDLEKLHPDFMVTDEELEEAHKIAKAFFEQLNKEIITLMINIIARAQFDDPHFQLPIEEAIGKIAREIILTAEEGADIDNSLPKFHYDLKMREGAAQLLSPALGLLPDWSFDSVRDIAKGLKELMRRFQVGTNENDTAIDVNSITRAERQWLLEQNHILTTLLHLKTMTRLSNPPAPGNSAN